MILSDLLILLNGRIVFYISFLLRSLRETGSCRDVFRTCDCQYHFDLTVIKVKFKWVIKQPAMFDKQFI